MLNLKNPAAFFLGSSTSSGFISHFKSTYNAQKNWHTYILKGSSGCGKSTLLQKICTRLQAADINFNIAYCTLNPNSLDAVIIPSLKICVMDGTAPHVIEPDFIGITETLVDLGVAIDSKKLHKNKTEILALFREKSRLMKRAENFIKVIASFNNDIADLARDSYDITKISAFSAELVKQKIPPKKSLNKPIEQQCFLSSYTSQGHIFLGNTIGALANEIITIEDEFGIASGINMGFIRTAALAAGYDIITCTCPLNPTKKIEHIILPELNLAFTTSNRWHKSINYTKRIHARRFINAATLRLSKQKINFNRRCIKELSENVTQILQNANNLHENLEKYYKNAIDFAIVDKITEDLITQISGFDKQA